MPTRWRDPRVASRTLIGPCFGQYNGSGPDRELTPCITGRQHGEPIASAAIQTERDGETDVTGRQESGRDLASAVQEASRVLERWNPRV